METMVRVAHEFYDVLVIHLKYAEDLTPAQSLRYLPQKQTKCGGFFLFPF